MQPKISIILPIYNVEKYLDRCMQSILNQTLRDIEIIMIDDGSPGQCPQMCDMYAAKDARVKVIHQQNTGAGYARNAGIKIATGEFMSFIDSDDYVELDMMEKMYSLAKERKLDAVSCGVKNINPDGSIRGLEYAYPEYHETNSAKECWEIATLTIGGEHHKKTNGVYIRHRPAVWRFLFNADIIHKNNIQFPSEREVFSEDSIFNIRFLTHSVRIGYIPNYYIFHCYNSDSLTATRKKLRGYNIYRNEYWMVCELCKESIYAPILHKKMANHYLGIVNSYLNSIIRSELSYKEKIELIKTIVKDRLTWNSIKSTLNIRILSNKRKLLVLLAILKAPHLIYIFYRTSQKPK